MRYDSDNLLQKLAERLSFLESSNGALRAELAAAKAEIERLKMGIESVDLDATSGNLITEELRAALAAPLGEQPETKP
jgi:predicted RNase H-like nuclease (RuvC/YqgF family)